MFKVNIEVLSTLGITELPNWVVWLEEPRGPKRKLTKVPFTPGTKSRAEADRPDTWRSFEQAVDTYQQGGWLGIGFEFGYSGVVGIDLDDCVNDDGTPEPWAEEIINEIDSYTEISVSGKGIHILAEGEIPVTGAAKHPYEIYATGRYFTLTGFIVGGRDKIVERTDAMTAFYRRVFRKDEPEEQVKQEAQAPREINGDDIANAAKYLDQLSISRCEEYTSWLQVGMALSQLGEVGLALWDRWSQKSDKYDHTACREKWRTITPGEGITLGSLHHWAEEDAEQPTTAKIGVSFRAAGRVLTVQHDCVYMESRNGKRQVSTYMFYPKRLLTDIDQGGEDAILGDIAASGIRWPDMVLPKSAFNSAASLNKALGGIYWQWIGNDNDVKTFLMYISGLLEEDGMPQAQSTAVVGRHGDYWVAKDLTMDATRSYSPSEAPVIFRATETAARNKLSDTAPNLELTFLNEHDHATLAKDIADNIVRCNHPDAVSLMVGWFFAAPLMSVFQSAGIRFPHLNVFGTKGSGKTTSVLRLFLPLMGQTRPSTWTPNTTAFVIRSLFSSTNGVPVSFGEFRVATLQSARGDFLRTLLMAYDTGRDARGQADLSTKTFDLLAPVVIDGEDALSDPAARERTIFVNLHPENIVEGSTAFTAMTSLMAMPLPEFAAGYLRYTLSIHKNDLADLFAGFLTETKKSPLHLPDRMRRNIAVVMCGQHLFNQYMGQFGGAQLNISVDAFTAMIQAQGILLSDGRSRSTVDDFVEDLVGHVATNVDYRFGFMLSYDKARNVLWFHLPSTHSWWVANLHRRGLVGLEATALKAQLSERALDSYVIEECVITTRTNGRLSCYGLSLARCVEAGLNVSERLDATSIEIRGGL